MRYELKHGDCLDVLRSMPESSVDSVVTDPPYGLAFMGKKWDYDVPSEEIWRECLRVLKPGGHLLAFAGTRTQHRMAVRIEDAGFEIRDMIAWVYGSGFPKSLDVSKAIDKANGREFADRYALGRHIRERREACGFTRAQVNEWLNAATKAEHYESDSAGFARVPTLADWRILQERLGLSDEWRELVERIQAEREVVGVETLPDTSIVRAGFVGMTAPNGVTPKRSVNITTPATEPARQWDGWGTALKPALEPITVARKPLVGTVAANVLAHGTGAINVDGCRVGADGGTCRDGKGTKPNDAGGENMRGHGIAALNAGRWPANLIHDGSDEVVGLFPHSTSGANPTRRTGLGYHGADGQTECDAPRGADSGSAARFFYCAKASKADRDEGNTHPTVKPTALMRYLCRLVTPPNGIVLDPFMGSGSTGKAAMLEGFRFIGIERDADYLEIAKARIASAVGAAASPSNNQQQLW